MRIPSVPRLLLAAAVAVWIAGCSHNSDRPERENPFKNSSSGDVDTKTLLTERELRLQADQLYRRARDATEAGDYQAAITRYDQLIAKYPFSDFSTQSEMEKVFALYKSQKPDEALSSADRFLRAHPRHPHADYVQYLKGLADFDRDQSLASMVGANSPKRDVSNLRRAFEDFALLLQKYPNSRYAGDARRRMLFARNKVADHELSIAKFYYSDRGAYVAAAKRATGIIADYPGAPATAEALEILKNSYTKLGLAQPAKDAETVAAINPTKLEYPEAPAASLTATAEPAPLAGAPAAAAGSKDSEGGILNGVSTTLGSGLAAVFDAVGITKADQQQGAAPAGTAAQPEAGTKAGAAAAPLDKSGNPISRTVNGLFGLLITPGSKPPPRHEELKLPKSQPAAPKTEPAPEAPAASAAAAPAAAAADAAVPAAPPPALLVPPPQGPTVQLEPPAGSAATPEKSPGLMGRFAHMFDVFDTSKPTHQHTLVLPKSGGSTAAPAAGATAAGAPAAPAATPAAPAPAQQSSTGLLTPPATAPEKSPGLMGRFAHMFDVFDTTKPENQHTLVLPSVTDGSSPAPAAADGTRAASGSKLHMEIGYPEAQPAQAAPAKPADTSAAPAATPAPDKPDDNKKSDNSK